MVPLASTDVAARAERAFSFPFSSAAACALDAVRVLGGLVFTLVPWL